MVCGWESGPWQVRMAEWIRKNIDAWGKARQIVFPKKEKAVEEAKHEALRMEMLDALRWVIQQRRLELSNRQLGAEWGVSHATAGRRVIRFQYLRYLTQDA